ncbi:hypothetical protein BGZ82_010701, partial [Podila clonocystis]
TRAECTGSTHYNTAASTTFYSNIKPWHITYGDISQVQGNLDHDLAWINDLELQNQQLALVTNKSREFDDKMSDIMGLTLGSLSSSIASTGTVFENMMARNLLGQGIFSFYLGKPSLAVSSDMIFGEMDSS